MKVYASSLADTLMARGQYFATADDIVEMLGITSGRVWGSIHRAVANNKLTAVTKGGWVPVPPEYRSAGAPPPLHFIDPMMKFMGHGYYIGFLSAAAIHGASHQTPMVCQVATAALLRDRRIGSSHLQFIRRSETTSRSTERRIVPTGRVAVSTPEVTVLDLVEAPRLGGGLSNVATVIGDLIFDDIININKLADDAAGYPMTVAQRAGHLIDFMSAELKITVDTQPLHNHVSNSRQTTVPLRPSSPSQGVRDDRWHVDVNTAVEHDL